MPDWLIVYLGSFQGGVMRDLAAELRAGGIGTVALAFTIGAVHALTLDTAKRHLPHISLGERHFPQSCPQKLNRVTSAFLRCQPSPCGSLVRDNFVQGNGVRHGANPTQCFQNWAIRDPLTVALRGKTAQNAF